MDYPVSTFRYWISSIFILIEACLDICGKSDEYYVSQYLELSLYPDDICHIEPKSSASYLCEPDLVSHVCLFCISEVLIRTYRSTLKTILRASIEVSYLP